MITVYLDDMEVPKPMVDVMVSTSSSEIRWIDSDTDGLRRPPSIAEWEDASCGSFTSEERNAFYKLAVKTNRSSQEQLLVTMLQEKLEKDGRCRTSLLDAQRGRVPSP
jgi:formylglycine-generating enzyme required for sulfatase activity